jgi:hypothetical protein
MGEKTLHCIIQEKTAVDLLLTVCACKVCFCIKKHFCYSRQGPQRAVGHLALPDRTAKQVGVICNLSDSSRQGTHGVAHTAGYTVYIPSSLLYFQAWTVKPKHSAHMHTGTLTGCIVFLCVVLWAGATRSSDALCLQCQAGSFSTAAGKAVPLQFSENS